MLQKLPKYIFEEKALRMNMKSEDEKCMREVKRKKYEDQKG